MTLPQLRLDLAEAKITLREAKADHATMTAIREQFAIDNGRAGGKNAEERERTLLIALDQDNDYIESRARLAEAEARVERLQAEIATLEDERAMQQLACREEANRALDRYAAALERAAQVNPVRVAIDSRIPF